MLSFRVSSLDGHAAKIEARGERIAAGFAVFAS